jgi:hypothetical protein
MIDGRSQQRVSIRAADEGVLFGSRVHDFAADPGRSSAVASRRP